MLSTTIAILYFVTVIFINAHSISNGSNEAEKIISRSFETKESVQRTTLRRMQGANGSSIKSVRKFVSSDCSSLDGDGENLTQTQLIKWLTDPCRYDRLEKPLTVLEDGTLDAVVNVFIRINYVCTMESRNSNDLRLNTIGLLQIRYVDHRLAFEKHAPKQKRPLLVAGSFGLRNLIWLPHIFFSNEKDSSILGTNEKDILTSIDANGTVIISARMQAKLHCKMKLKMFPFDEQLCWTHLQSWFYNSNELILHWDHRNCVNKMELALPMREYYLIGTEYSDGILNAIVDRTDYDGTLAANYSSLILTMHLSRRSYYYVLEYFIPSIIIVLMSFSTFWLQGDQTSPRTTLGLTTILSLITLSLAQDDNLPKVSYVKIMEIWFLTCIIFIFFSFIESTFVNTIWRRKRHVQLKKVNSKHVLKSTFVPRDARSGNTISRIASNLSSMEIPSENFGINEVNDTNVKRTWATMTPQEVALWIDQKSRIYFPLAFLIFNIAFWIVAYCC